MKRIISLLCVLSMVLTSCFLFSSCSKNSEENTITIWAYDSYIDTAKEAAQMYKDINPGVTIEIVELGQDDLVQKLNIALSSGKKDSLPDIVCEEDYNLKSYISYYKDCFVDLTDHVNKDNYVDFKVKNCTVDGRIWAIPYDTGVSAWFYRYDILKEAGYEEKDLENITWSKFIEIGRNVLDKTGKYLIPLVPEGNIEGRVILQSANSLYYDAEGNLDISQNNALADMSKVIKDIYNSGVVDKVSSWDDIISSFYNGDSAGVIGGSWWATTIMANEDQKGLWRVTQVPRMEGNTNYTNYGSCGGCSWLVCNTDSQETSIDFLKKTIAVSNDIANKMVEKACVVPALKTAFHVENAVKGSAYFGNQNICEKMAEWGEFVPYCNYSKNSYEIAYAHGEMMNEYIKGVTSVEEMLQELYKEAQTIEGNE